MPVKEDRFLIRYGAFCFQKGPDMKRVRWEIDVDEDTPEAAAVVALAMQRDPESTATVFDITSGDGKTVRVDLRRSQSLLPALKCDNCGCVYGSEEELDHVFPDIPRLLDRIGPGGMVPSGECRVCGALVYPVHTPVSVAILLDGGLVSGVVANRNGVRAAVLDLDTEGVDDGEVVALECCGVSLEGTTHSKHTESDPAFTSALFARIRAEEAGS